MDKLKEFMIKDWKTFLNMIDDLETLEQEFPLWSFRGQSNSEWGLSSSLCRIAIDAAMSDPEKAAIMELKILRNFISSASHFNEFNDIPKNLDNPFPLLIKMQHYGCPTRLLDWSHSPLIAAYFATNEMYNKDGALFVINNHLVQKASEERYGKTNLKIFPESEINDSITPIIPTLHSRRSLNQQGLFTIGTNILADHEHLISQLNLNKIDELATFKIIIPRELKLEFQDKLKIFNIRADILFPDIYGFSRELFNIANKYAKS